jgi:trk system potassium uptake protein TrkA
VGKRSVVVIGLGNFGMAFLRSAAERGFDVLAVDLRQEVVDRAALHADRAVVADATDRAVLEHLDVQGSDTAVVSMGGRMDPSILAVLHLKSLGVRDICVKAISDDHARVLEAVGATRVIHPEREVAELLAQRLAHPTVREYLPLLGEYAVVELQAPEDFDGKTLRDLHLRNRYGVSVIAMAEGNVPDGLAPPNADRALAAGDLLVLIGKREDLDRFGRSLEP